MRAQIRELKKKNQLLTNELAALKKAKEDVVSEAQKEVLERLLKVTRPSQIE
jgi:FtsZ-binding cell division protein ZapB